MLRAIRDENNNIVDFEYILENETVKKTPDHLKRLGKKFLKENGDGDEFFRKMAELVKAGEPSRADFPLI